MPVVDSFGANLKCSICQQSEIDALNYGEIHVRKDIAVHLFCLYFSTHLPQLGKDNAGIVGFEIRDLRKLIEKSKNTCCYCRKPSATTYCHFPNCGRVFHQICGFKANGRFEYLNEFRSFCDRHTDIEGEDLEYPTINGCWICYEQLGDYSPVTTVPSCCGRWFHQQCLRKYAINAGYAFMCPLCRNKNFGDFARRHGIYVPEYEALWEKTHDYQDIERFYQHCDVTECLCPKGRTFVNQKWTLQVCSGCGSYGLHTLCRSENERENKIICNVCAKVIAKSTNDAPIRSPATNETITSTSNQPVADVIVLEALSIRAGSNDAVEMIVDLTHEVENEENVQDGDDSDENLADKRRREKAERPYREEMRNFRISLLFREYKRRGTKKKNE